MTSTIIIENGFYSLKYRSYLLVLFICQSNIYLIIFQGVLHVLCACNIIRFTLAYYLFMPIYRTVQQLFFIYLILTTFI